MYFPPRKPNDNHTFPFSVSALSFAIILLTGLLMALASGESSSANSDRATSARPAKIEKQVAQTYDRLPLGFVANQGQTDSHVRYLSRGNGYTLFLTSNEAVLALSAKQADEESRTTTDVVRMKLVGAKRNVRVTGLDQLPGRLNYFIGNDPSGWRTNVPTYSSVRYRHAYPGIDLIYHGTQGQLEYDFMIAPGASAQKIKLAFNGMRQASLDAQGNLILSTAGGDVRQPKPVAYQEVNGQRREVPVRYKLNGTTATFDTGVYDTRLPLVIDPVIVFSSFLGGIASEQGWGVAVDTQGSAYLAGQTTSTDFPTAGAPQSTKDAFNDAFVVKLNPAGTALMYGTYVGGNGDDIAESIAVDSQGSAYIVGLTGSGSFPRTAGVVQDAKDGFTDAFITKLSPDGSSLVYSSFLGGDNSETAFGVAVDATGRAYVAGRTDSTHFRTIPFPNLRNGSSVSKSTNNAGQWTSASSGLSASTTFQITIDPHNSSTIYASTNYGVFRSTDGTSSWTLTGGSPPINAPSGAIALTVDPTNSSTLYVAAFNGLYKSTNGGATYVLKSSGYFVVPVETIAIDPSTPNTVYAGTSGDLSNMWRSTNGGDTWAPLNNGLSNIFGVNDIVIDPSNVAVIYIATSQGLFKSTNGGNNWGALNQANFSSTQFNALAFDPLNSQTIYAGAVSAGNPNDSMFKSTDGGATWAATGAGLQYSFAGLTFNAAVKGIAVDPASNTTLYAATSGGGLFKSTDAGAHWNPANNGFQNSTALDVVIDATNPATVYAATSIGADVFALRLNPTATAFEYLYNFGGTENDEARGVAIDTDNTAYLVGTTNSQNFPTANPFQAANGGGFSEAFVSKLNASGSGLVYSSTLGGNSSEAGRGIAVRNGAAYVVGQTSSSNFPTVNAIRSAPINFDTDAFITKVNPTGATVDFSTCLGGSGGDQAFAVALDSIGYVYVTGATISPDFPSIAAPQPSPLGGQDAFVTRLDATGASILYSTYLGGFTTDSGNGIAVNSAGNAFVIGTTSSSNFPTVSAFQSTLKGSTDAFVTKIGVSADLALTKSDSRDPVMVNNPLSYTLRATNNGPSAATGVEVADTLPAGLTFVSANSTQGSCVFNAPVVTCSVGNLATAANATITIAVTPTSVGTVTNNATIAANETDDTQGNNSATQSTKVSSLPSINGSVKDSNSVGVSGVLVTLSGSQSGTTQTDNAGFYQFAELPSGGNYTVTPSKTNLSFAPPMQTFNSLNADQTADFVASTCTYDLIPLSQSFGSNGGTGSVQVSSLNGCPWNAVTVSNWITITSGASGVGDGNVNFSVAPTAVPRVGHITVGGKVFPVYQEFNACGLGFSVASYNASASPTVARVADFNGDGLPDVFLATTGLSGASLAAHIMLNNGSGGFNLNTFDSGLGTPTGYAVADFNGDGRPDIAGTNYNNPFVKILFNNGSGSFGQSSLDVAFTSQGESPLTQGVFARDINNDGKADLLVLTYNNTIQILLGNGNATFNQLTFVNPGPYSLANIADFNHDGKQDLLLAAGANANPLGVMLGNGDGTFGSVIPSGGIDYAGTTNALGDFDGDDNLDIVVPTSTSPPSSSTAIVVMSGDGNGHFVKKSSFTIDRVSKLAAGDFNNDGKVDIAITAGGTGVTVLLGDGLGGVGSPIQIETGGDPQFPGNYEIATADFTGDGRLDMAVANYTLGAHVLRNHCITEPAISGRVTDSRRGIGLAGVAVKLGPSLPIAAVTDSSGNYFIGNLTAGANYEVIPSKPDFRFNPASISVTSLNGTQTANFIGTPIVVQFSQNHYLVQENVNVLHVDVSRTGDLSGVTTVDYSTVNGTASDRSDFTAAVGRLRFAPGESVQSFNVLFTDDALIEGFESLRLVLSNAKGAILATSQEDGSVSDVLVEIQDNDFNIAQNPIENSTFFVRQHYHDFLNREPDTDGLNFWVDQIESCGNNSQCREIKRINVSAAFFLSIEFQETGYLAYRMYNAAYGETTSPNVPGTVPIIRLQEFLPDSQQIGEGVQVGIGNWQEKLEENKVAYALDFVQRARFISAFPLSMTADAFVDKLDQNTHGALSSDEKGQLVALLGTTPSDPQKRSVVVRAVAEDDDLKQHELNRAFVLMQYYGYLRRNPDDPQDTDFRGWKFWLDKLNEFNGNFVNADMVKSFLVSGEYRSRFGTP